MYNQAKRTEPHNAYGQGKNLVMLWDGMKRTFRRDQAGILADKDAPLDFDSYRRLITYAHGCEAAWRQQSREEHVESRERMYRYDMKEEDDTHVANCGEDECEAHYMLENIYYMNEPG